MFIHSNIDARLGTLGYLFNGPAPETRSFRAASSRSSCRRFAGGHRARQTLAPGRPGGMLDGAMPVRTKRWNDSVEPEDGFRLLICRYRPRGVRKDEETWHASCPALAPSPALHAAFYGKSGPAIDWAEYASRFRAEMQAAGYFIGSFAERVRQGETITLLCSSACSDETRCHRSIVRELIERAAGVASSKQAAADGGAGAIRRRPARR